MAEQYITNVNEKNLILNRAKAAVISHDFTTAARLYKQLLRDEPSNVDYLKELGSIYVKDSEDEKAIPYYEQIITFYPHYIEAMNSLGAIFRRLKRYDESINILQRALDEGRQTSAVNYNLGFTYKEMGNYKDAIDAFDAVIAENPSDVLAYNHLGSIYLAEKEYDKSIATFRRGLQVDPNHPILNYNLAHCYEEAKQENDAIRCYDKALKARPGWIDAIKDYSSILIKSQKTKEASDLVQRSIQLHPNDSKLLGMLGKIYLDQFDFDSAEKAFKRANSVDSNDVEILRGLAEALEKGAKPLEAVDAVSKAMEMEPDNQDIKKQYVHTLLSAQEYDAAHDNVQGLYKNDGKEDPQVLDLYGQYYICTNNDEEAQEYYSEIEKNNLQYKDHILSAASRYSQIGKTDEAELKAKEYISKVSKDPKGYHVLGNVYEQQGEYQKAIDSYNTSKELFKPNILADKQISHLQGMLKKEDVPQEIEEEPVVQEVEPEVVEEAPVAEVEEKEDEFDFGTMGDNVPMGEALLEKEDDFFDDLDKAIEDEPEEPEEEPVPEPEEEEEKPVYKPASYDNLEDESLSPFDDLEEEPKSVSEQLVPDADFSEDTKKDELDDDFIFDSLGNDSGKSDNSNPSDNSNSKESSNDEDILPSDAPASSDSKESSNPFADEDAFDPFEPYSAQEPFDNPEPYNPPQSNNAPQANNASDPYEKQNPYGNSNPYENSMPYENSNANPYPNADANPNPYNQQPSYDQPYSPPRQTPQPDMESSMSQFADQMQKRMQEAMMDSAKYAMDTAMNAQKLASQIAEEQEKLRKQMDNIGDSPAVKAEPEKTSEPQIETAAEPEIMSEPESESMFESEPESVSDPEIATEPEIIDEPEIMSEPEFSEESESPVLDGTDQDSIFVEPETENQMESSVQAEPAAEENLAGSFANISDILSDLDIDDLTESNAVSSAHPLMTPSAILPKIERILANEEIAEENSPKLELFKKLLSFREYLDEQQRQEFDSGRIRMLLEYIIAKMSGKPGLLKTVQSLIKSGMLGDDYEIPQTQEEYDAASNALVKKVLCIMKDLCLGLEDQNLAKALCNCADSVLERIELEEKKSEIF